jgi:hypothetical protein
MGENHIGGGKVNHWIKDGCEFSSYNFFKYF